MNLVTSDYNEGSLQLPQTHVGGEPLKDVAKVTIDPTAVVSPSALIGAGTRIWQHVQVRENAVLGEFCILGKGSYVDAGVRIGSRVKVQNGVSIFAGVTLEDGVFCGPHCVFTNDLTPRAVNADGSLKSAEDWVEVPTLVKYGASIGANAVIICGTTIGRWAMIGSGAVVSRDVPDHALVYGNPARIAGFVCSCGARLAAAPASKPDTPWVRMQCKSCGETTEIAAADYARLPARK